MRNVTRLAIITTMVLWLGGCTANLQIGKTNVFEQKQRTNRDTYHARKRAGQVSIQETLEHVRGEK